MQMNVLVSAVLFLFIGPFDRASSWEAKTTDSAILQVNPQHVFISVNETLVLNCSITTPNHGLLPSQLLWKHNNVWMLNSSHVVDNSTVQLRISHTRYEDAGVYGCGVFYNSSLFQYVPTQNLTVVVGEKPKLGRETLTLVNASGKPVQELTLQYWTTALQINVTYKLFLGRPHHYRFVFNNKAVCTWSWMLGNKSELLCRVGKDVLGQLFQWSDLIDHSKCTNQGFKCDTLCAKVVAQNAFGTSENISSTWNLLNHALCPSPRHLNVMSGDYGVRVSWQRPLLVWKKFSVFYQLTYNGTQVLSGMRLPAIIPLRQNFKELNYTITAGLVPFSRYTFAVSCKFFDLSAYKSGPSVYTEMTSREEVPSKAPTCEVTNKSIDGRAFVSLKPPPKNLWNGLPRRYVVDYVHSDQHNSINVSLGGLNMDRPLGVWLNDTEAHKNYSVRVTMCTGAGCRGNFSQPCFIDAVTEDSNNEVGVDTPKPGHQIGVVVWVSIAGLAMGLVLCAFIAYSIKRKRSRKRHRPSLETLFVGLEFPNGSRNYENDLDDGPSLCEESQYYDTIPSTHLLKDVDCTVGNCPVTEI